MRDPLREAFVAACELDVAVRKPGNVSDASPGHRMDAAMFRTSAQAAADALVRRGAPVGERILGAVRATQAAVQCNTNLGIVLLAAPVLHAAERLGPTPSPAELQSGIGQTLAGLGIDDARSAFAAIALAQPGGLGTAAQQDVSTAPTVGLREAMALAADRDLIAAQYANGFEVIFSLTLPAFRHGAVAAARGMQQAFVELLASRPDSHIVRKLGGAVAQCVMDEAAPWRMRSHQGAAFDADAAFAAWDESLKQRGINPGTSADVCVATALVDALTSH